MRKCGAVALPGLFCAPGGYFWREWISTLCGHTKNTKTTPAPPKYGGAGVVSAIFFSFIFMKCVPVDGLWGKQSILDPLQDAVHKVEPEVAHGEDGGEQD